MRPIGGVLMALLISDQVQDGRQIPDWLRQHGLQEQAHLSYAGWRYESRLGTSPGVGKGCVAVGRRSPLSGSGAVAIVPGSDEPERPGSYDGP